MATKDDFLFLKDSKNQQLSFSNDQSNNVSHQFTNLNLNQNNHHQQSSDLASVQSHSNSIHKNCDTNYDSNNDVEQHHGSTFSNFVGLKSNTLQNKIEEEEDKKSKKKDDENPSTNKSTLSLHIAAYENSIEVGDTDNAASSTTEQDDSSIKKKSGNGFMKKLKNVRQVFASPSSAVVMNETEFPRQQNENQITDPEVVQWNNPRQYLTARSSSGVRRPQRFFKVCSFLSNNRLKVSLYRSTVSGMRVAFVDHLSPVVKGWFSFATKTTSDDGLPHTLEHLVLMGTLKYPCKGLLSSIAQRCLASGANGYTVEDHTAYSVTTVGNEGFSKILPVYLDHLFFPMLTPEQYTTEIHHINGEGRDAGVLYAEMQAEEVKFENILSYEHRCLAFPADSPHRANTGGALPAIRDQCSLERVKNYHKLYYNLPNMIITIIGSVVEKEVIDILSNYEGSLSTRPLTVERPFKGIILPERYERQIKYVQLPAEKGTAGELSFAWQGPLLNEPEIIALRVLLSYFCDGPDSLLHQNFVQIRDPVCSNVSKKIKKRSRMELLICFIGVKAKLLTNEDLFAISVLTLIRESEIDMERMKAIIEQKILQMDVMLEGNPSDYYHDIFSTYALHAPGVDFNTDSLTYLENELNEVKNLKFLLQQDVQYWKNLVKNFFTKDQIIVIGVPNSELAAELARKEEERVKIQIKRLGPEGLKKCGEILKEAVNKNEASAPSEDFLNQFNIRAEEIKLIDIQRILNKCDSSNPYPTVFHKVEWSFLQATVLIDIHSIPAKYRSVIRLYMELLTESDVRINGEVISYQNVATMLKKDFIKCKIDLGVRKDYQEFLAFHYILLPDKLSNIAKWTEIFLKNVVFENSRIAAVSTRLALSAPTVGADLVEALHVNVIAAENSNKLFNCLLSSFKLHDEVAKLASSGKSDKMVEIMNDLAHKIIACPTNVHLIGNADSLKIATSNGWKASTKVENTHEFLTGSPERSVDLSQNKGATFCIPLGINETAFLIQRSEAKFDFLDSRLILAKLLSHYFCQSEGPLHNHIRGQGLAYGVYIYPTGSTGIEFYIYCAPDVLKAYDESKNLVLETIISRKIDADKFVSAKRSLISLLVQSVSHAKKVGKFSIVEQLRGISPSESIVKYQIDQIWKATPEKMFDAISQTFLDLFDDAKCVRSVVLSESDLKKAEECFNNIKIMKIENLCFENLVTE